MNKDLTPQNKNIDLKMHNSIFIYFSKDSFLANTFSKIVGINLMKQITVIHRNELYSMTRSLKHD